MSFPSEAFDLVEEVDALSTLDAHIGGEEVDLDSAFKFVRRAANAIEPTSVGEWLLLAAMAKILAKPIRGIDFAPVSGPADQHVFTTCATAWMRWAEGRSDLARAALDAGASEDLHLGRGGALHVMALTPFRAAIEALIRNDTTEARRLFRRSIEIGTQMGTETNPIIQWAFVASFFKHG